MPGKVRIKRHVLPPKARTLVRIIGGAVVVAVVALVVGVATNVIEPPSKPAPAGHPSSAVTTYNQGMAALTAGETTRAVQLLTESAAAGSADAQKALQDIRAPKPPQPSAVPTAAFESVAGNPGSLLPTRVAGFDLAAVEKSGASAIVSGEPTVSGPRSSVTRIVFTVLDRKTNARAVDWLDSFETAYPKNVVEVRAADVPAVFGTDGARLASVSFVRGRFAFEVVGTAVGGNPNELRPLMLQIASNWSVTHAK